MQVYLNTETYGDGEGEGDDDDAEYFEKSATAANVSSIICLLVPGPMVTF